MRLIKPKFWERKLNIFTLILIPFSLIVIFIVFLKEKFIKSKKFKIPIICIGNIYIGGTGKTPTAILLGQELLKLGKKPVILRKYYKGHSDEYNLIKSKFNKLIINKDRMVGIFEAENNDFDTVILDDGFQDYKIEKSKNILCFNSNQLIGNGLVLPAGPLRERLRSIKRAHMILINGSKNKDFENKILKINNHLSIFYSNYKPVNLDEFKNKSLLAFVGIGNPENFFETLKQNNLFVKKKFIFPDHHIFSNKEVEKLIHTAEENKLKIITTEKDFFKLKSSIYKKSISFLKISLEIEDKNKFIKKILKSYD